MPAENGANGHEPPPTLAQIYQAAAAFHREGSLDQAAPLYESVLAADSGHVLSLYGLGLIHGQAGRFEEAITLLGRAVARAPDFAEGHNDLGRLLQAVQRHDEALVHHRTALALKPTLAEAHSNCAAALQALSRLDEAIAEYEQALALKPDSAELHSNFGNALQAARRYDAAVAQYETALALRPDFVVARCNLGVALQALHRPDAAIACFEAVLALKPDDFDAHYNLGLALWALGRRSEALAHYERALADEPPYPEAYRSLGHLLTELGRLAEATAAFEKAVALAPRRPEFYRALADAKRFTAGDPHVTALEDLARHPGFLTMTDQMELHFALGKAYADLGQPELSFDHLRQGNAIKRRQIAYDESAALAQVERIQATFTPALLQARQGQGDPSRVPVFIVGMWRSGTTLVEQILASHPDVFGAGELNDFAAAVAQRGDFPDIAPRLTGDQLRQLGADYLARVTAMAPMGAPPGAPTAARITDKMPPNFLFVGLIHLALPNARIIHTRRDPVDTCLSCFSRLFTNDQPYIYDLGELGRYYRAYQALMAHWRRVLPAGVMIDVDYEDLVADVASQARRIVAHCGLDWDVACLEFHKSPRPVRTASAAQVRQPIYRTAIGRWRPLVDVLRPLIDGLAGAAPENN